MSCSRGEVREALMGFLINEYVSQWWNVEKYIYALRGLYLHRDYFPFSFPYSTFKCKYFLYLFI